MKKLLIFAVISISFFIFSQPVYSLEKVAASSAVLKNQALEIKKPDRRVKKLEAFLGQYNAPLAFYAKKFIEAADDYQLDWRLVPAITGVESSFGKRIPANSYNAYGWANGHYWFQSWEQSIDYVSCYLRERYINRGLDTPDKIGPVYAPPSPFWASRVVYFMKQISDQENYPKLDLTF